MIDSSGQKRLSIAAIRGKSGGQMVASNDPSALVATQALTQGSRRMPPYIDRALNAQAFGVVR